MWRISFYYVILLISGAQSAIEECKTQGIFACDDPEKFVLCAEKEDKLIRSELYCNNHTVYSGEGAGCIPKNNGIIRIYNLFSIGFKDNTKITINCITPGVICSSCNELTVCEGDINPDGTTTINVLSTMKCSPGEHCAIGTGCTSDNSQYCSLGPFQCDDVGVFPDPYDCQIYHICKEKNMPTPLTQKCSSGSFNSQTASCGYSMDSSECQTRPVSFCKKLFQAGQVTGNANMYYICVMSRIQAGVLTPSLHRCPPYQTFDVNKLSCV